VLLFADDLNMPKLDPYGSQPPIELLRQLVDFGGLYDREKLFWKVSKDIPNDLFLYEFVFLCFIYR